MTGAPPAGPLLAMPDAKPWLRYFARWFDIQFAGFFVRVLASVLPAVSILGSSTLFTGNIVDAGMLALAVWALVEGPILSRFGTTPGKALLGIFVRTPDGGYPRLGDAAVRSLRVWVEGLAFGFPIVLLFAWNRQHRRLLTGKSTTWDAGRFKVLHTPLTLRRRIVAVLVTAAVLAMMVLGFTRSLRHSSPRFSGVEAVTRRLAADHPASPASLRIVFAVESETPLAAFG